MDLLNLRLVKRRLRIFIRERIDKEKQRGRGKEELEL